MHLASRLLVPSRQRQTLHSACTRIACNEAVAAHAWRALSEGVVCVLQMLEGPAADGESDEESAEQREQLRRDLLLGHLLARSLGALALGQVAADLAQQGLLPR